MKDGLKDKYRQAIIDILSQCEQVEKVVLFGSRAMGTFTITSDVDIVLFGDKLTLTDQGNLAEQIEELTMPQSADLLLYRTIESKELLKHIREYGMQWWPEKNEQMGLAMENNWRESTWGEEISLEYGKRLQGYKDGIGNYRVYGSNGPVGWTKKSLAPGLGVILGRKGANRGVEFSKDPFFVIDTAYYVKPKTELDMRWLYYAIKHYDLGEINDGSPIPSTTRAAVYVSKLQVPSITEQRAIAHILGSLDDKIELNRRMNETLEAMAQALFKSWFVDFDPVIDNALAAGNEIPEELKERADIREALGDARKPLPEEIQNLFPSEFEHTEEMGWIPKGWRVVTLDDLVDLIGGGTPKTSNEDYWNGSIPWFSVVDAPNTRDVFVIDTEKHVTELGVEKSSTKILPIGTTIISARGTVGKCAMVGESMAMNQSCYGGRGKKHVSDSFVYYAIREKVADLQRGGHGSVFNTITRDTFKTIKIAFGEPELTGKLDDRIKPNFDRILANRFCSKILSKTRDTLLPQLLSGEIRIPEAEKLVEEMGIMRDEL
jgi:type I restriction enzyme S subunit